VLRPDHWARGARAGLKETARGRHEPLTPPPYHPSWRGAAPRQPC
jgi:hypothetical protein